VIPVSGDQGSFGEQVLAQLRAAGIRAEVDMRNETLGARIREAELQKVPWMLVVGEKEVQAGAVAPRPHKGKGQPALPVQEFIDKIRAEAQIPSGQK